ncbi:hypothetical protein [Lentibacillus sp. Marseille-P4043]|uniref:hypothetical protein n=1 Tax=Lentibacillus sp. Marseille-P4043 TaxID=2040293 RepID=UPI000D0B5BDA|nr:hypothetical protein [Lentibacillus sp. Marseille-P4043]
MGTLQDAVLTEKESQLKDDIMSLYFLKQIDFFNDDLKKKTIENNPEYANPVKASINLEKEIIKTIGLKKESITASLQKKSKQKDSDTTKDNQNIQRDRKKYDDKLKEVDHVTQKYVVSLIIPLTAIEKSSSDIQSTLAGSSIYSKESIGRESAIIDDIKKNVKIILNASDIIMNLRAPKNTDYAMKEQMWKKYAKRYSTISRNIIKNLGKNQHRINELEEILQDLDYEVSQAEIKFGELIAENHYSEYDSLITLLSNDNKITGRQNSIGQAVIASQIRVGIIQAGRNVEQDVKKMNRENREGDKSKSEAIDKGSKKDSGEEYEPKYMSPDEWETCINSEAYTIEECIRADKYYSEADPYEWAPGVKEKFENKIVELGYVDSKDNIRYKEYKVNENNEGLLEVYREKDGAEIYIVVVNVKTGWFHG